MKPLRYEPGRVVGGALGAALAILVYYDVLDVEGAGLWGALLALVIPPLQAEITRRFTMPVAKITDAGHEPEQITADAKRGRERRKAMHG